LGFTIIPEIAEVVVVEVVELKVVVLVKVVELDVVAKE
jgi:hypothetical protein